MSNVRTLVEGYSDYEKWVTDPRPRIGFGLPILDANTNGGLAKSEIAMLMAFSSVGKTTLGLQAVINNPDVPILFFSLEMNFRMVAARLAAINSGVSTMSLENQYRDGNRPSAIEETARKYHKFVCDDTPAIKLKDAKESYEIATERLGEPPRLVIWDYMELIGGSGMLGKAEQVDKCAEKLRDWTRELDCSTLVLHQVGKGDAGGGSKPLDLSSGRYGGYAPMDFVLGAYAERLNPELPYSQREIAKQSIHLQLLKNRAGQSHPEGVRYRMDPVTMRVTPWSGSFLPHWDSHPVQAPDEFDGFENVLSA